MALNKNLIIRSISGLVLVFVIIASILYSEFSRYTILSLIGLLGCWEFLGIYKKNNIRVIPYFPIIYSIVGLILFYVGLVGAIIPLIVLYFLHRTITELYRKNENPLESITYEVFSVLYTILPMILLTTYDIFAIFAVIIFVWINDVGAYLVGSTLGKRRLFERISPKKSWEGFWGGFFFVVAFSTVFGYYSPDHNYIYWIVVAAILSVSAVFGDLFESLMKRSVGIKDSGNIIPGHGGILDRFDALYFASFAYFIISHIYTNYIIVL